MASDKAIDEKNIKTLRNLQKLPENKRCFNCDSLGTTYVVPQFSIFVCTDCSGIHMQCGQRVKSISMAKFTTEEVKGLQDGGNDVAGKKFLAKYTQNDLQKPHDKNPKKIEQWVRMVFVERQFYSDAPVASRASEASSASLTSKGMAAPPTKSVAAPAKSPQSSLLDGDSPSPAQAAGSSSGWAAFGSTAPSAPAASSNTDVFGVFTATSGTPASAAAPFDPFAAAPPQSSSTAASHTFDPFSNTTPSVATRGLPPTAAPTAAAFDPFRAPHTSAPKAAPAAASSGWSAFDTSHAPTPPVATAPPSNDWAAFGGPTHPAPQTAPAAAFDPFGSGRAAHASRDFQPFGAAATPGAGASAAAAVKPAEPAGPKELPSDLFTEPAFPAPSMGSSLTMGGIQSAAQYGMGHTQPTHPMGMMGGNLGGSFTSGPQPGMHGAFPGAPHAPGMTTGSFSAGNHAPGMGQGSFTSGHHHGAPTSPSGYAPVGLMGHQNMGGFSSMGGPTSPTAMYGGAGPSAPYGMAPGAASAAAMPSYGMGPGGMGGYGGMMPNSPGGMGAAQYGMPGQAPPMMPGMTPGMAHPPPMPGYPPHAPGNAQSMPGNSSGGYPGMQAGPMPTMGSMPGGNGYAGAPAAAHAAGAQGNPFGADPAPAPPKPEDMLFTDLMGDFSNKLSVSKPGAPAHTNGLDAGHGMPQPAPTNNSGNPFAF